MHGHVFCDSPCTGGVSCHDLNSSHVYFRLVLVLFWSSHRFIFVFARHLGQPTWGHFVGVAHPPRVQKARVPNSTGFKFHGEADDL